MSDPDNVHRRIGSYENACLVLNASPLQAPDTPLKPSGQFGVGDWLEQLPRVVAISQPSALRPEAFPLPVGLPGRPEVIAEFAAALQLERSRGQLALAEPRQRTRYSDRANLSWIAWGDLIVATNGTLAIAPLGIGPWPGAVQQLEPGSHNFNGITTDVLRAIHPETLIRAVVKQLETIDGWQQYLANRHNPQNPEEHQREITDALERARSPRPRDGRSYPDQHYHDIAVLYLNLLTEGHRRRITSQLAEQLNVPTATARNWIHRARQLGYLTPSRQGQPGAHPGPQLTRPARAQSTRDEST